MDELCCEYGISHFQFLDDNFTADTDRAAALSRLLLGRKYIWSCQTTIEEVTTDLHLLDLMFEAGCREVYFGLESGSDRIMRRFKNVDPESAFKVLSHAASISSRHDREGASRLQTVVGFILGLPEDDEQSIEETAQFALRLRSIGVDTMVSILQPYPGSAIYRDPGSYGIIIENSDFAEYLYPKANISTRALTRSRLRTLYSSVLLRIMQTY